MAEGIPQEENGVMQAIVTGDDPIDYAPAVRIFRGGDGFAVMKQCSLSDGVRRLTHQTTASLGKTKLYMATFSTDLGLSIYENGVKVKENSGDKNQISAKFKAGEWSVLRNCMSKVGIIGILSVDLNKPINTIHRHKIETYLMSRYGA